MSAASRYYRHKGGRHASAFVSRLIPRWSLAFSFFSTEIPDITKFTDGHGNVCLCMCASIWESLDPRRPRAHPARFRGTIEVVDLKSYLYKPQIPCIGTYTLHQVQYSSSRAYMTIHLLLVMRRAKRAALGILFSVFQRNESLFISDRIRGQ